jgi:hypothetical protein
VRFEWEVRSDLFGKSLDLILFKRGDDNLFRAKLARNLTSHLRADKSRSAEYQNGLI